MAGTTGATPRPPTTKITPPTSDRIGQRRSTKKLAVVTGARPARGTAGWHDATQPVRPTTKLLPAYGETGRPPPAGFGNPLYAYLGVGDLVLARLRAFGEWPMLQRTVTQEATKMQAAWKADLTQLHQSLSPRR